MQFAATCTSCVLLMTALMRAKAVLPMGGARGGGGNNGGRHGDGGGNGGGNGGGDGGGGDGGGGDGDLDAENTSTSARFSTRDAPGSTIVTYHPETPPQSNAKGPYVEGAI